MFASAASKNVIKYSSRSVSMATMLQIDSLAPQIAFKMTMANSRTGGSSHTNEQRSRTNSSIRGHGPVETSKSTFLSSTLILQMISSA